jgi:hypothetical protein
MDTWSSDSASQADRKYGESTEGRAAVLGARPRRSPASTCENSTKRRHSSSTLSRYWGPAGRWSFRRLACASEKHWEERSDWYHFPWLPDQDTLAPSVCQAWSPSILALGRQGSLQQQVLLQVGWPLGCHRAFWTAVDNLPVEQLCHLLHPIWTLW